MTNTRKSQVLLTTLDRIILLVLAACTVTGVRAVDSPFVGKWKLNPSRSQITDLMKVEAAGTNKYTFTFSGTDTETIVADGTDQTGIYGTTLAVTVEKPARWKVVRKKNGRTIISATWNLSEDGTKLTDAYTETEPNGSTMSVDYVYKRTAGGAGFAGTWESTSQQMNSVYELQIRPYEDEGLSIMDSGAASAKNIKFDGKDYPRQGAGTAPGAASSGRRVDDRTVEVTDKIKDKILDTQRIQLSHDLKTLTITVQPVGQSKPNILVFDRE
jgi:hypothetical protein